MATEAILAWFKELRGITLGRRGPEFSPESLRTLLDNLPIAVSMTAGREHRFVYANRLYRHILLPHAGDPVGRTVGEVFGALYSAEFAAARDRLLGGGEANSMREVPIDLGETAPQMYWDVSQVPILDNEGTAQGVLTLGIEVTEKVLARREAERQAAEAMARAEEARQEHHRLELAAEAADLGIWEWEVETGRLHWSERQKLMWGLPADHDAGYETWEDALHPEDREPVLTAVQAVLDPSSGGHLRVEHRIVRPDGAVRWIIGQARMLYDAAGQPLRLIGTAVDATDRKQGNEALRQALAAKEILLREVNHRVKNSLALVSSMLALQGRSIDDETLRRQIEDAQARIRTVALVHERLYTSAGTDSVRLDTYLKELCEDLQRTGLGGAVRIEFAAEPVRLANDRAVPVALVLNELVTNALKYAYGSGGGTVWVDLRKAESGEMCLVVRDQGAGLPPDFAARRAASLGFRIIDGLMRQLGGRFEAREPQRGAEFALFFRAD
ncbi:MAG TPA: histidine kinase dimerization/phosphoacceptor domain -containing protein [Afifellaceae bacterium]|nr:histidine kinase dimerization/phosphoacceptor domain -containing protein [Afifellaceae bacterium]